MSYIEDDSHMQVWAWETAELDRAWEQWADTVERLLGHDLDGSLRADGYSLDTAYEMWQGGLTPEDAWFIIEYHKAALQ